jgi:hypothetical protein
VKRVKCDVQGTIGPVGAENHTLTFVMLARPRQSAHNKLWAIAPRFPRRPLLSSQRCAR